MAADGRSGPIDWGTSFGRSNGHGPEPDANDRSAEDSPENPPKSRSRFGGGGSPGGGARTSVGRGAGWGRGRPAGGSSFDSPFAPVVGSSADGPSSEDGDVGGANGAVGTSSRGARSRRDAGGSFSRPRSASRRRLSSEDPVPGSFDDPSPRGAVEAGCDPQGLGEPSRSQEEWSSEARSVLLRQLALSPRSRHQLATTLAEREVPAEVANALLDRFEEVKLIDDAEFARMWVRSRASGKSLARSSLRRELADKGIDTELAEAALLQITDDDEHEQARDLVRRRVRSSTDLSDRQARDKEVRRLVGMLARKGHGPGVGFSIVREVLAEQQAEDPGDLGS